MMVAQNMAMQAAALLEQRRRLYRSDILGYLNNRLNIRREDLYWSERPEYVGHKWDGTVDPHAKICEAIQAGKWVGVESATNVGKTFMAAAIATWFFDVFDDAVVVTVAPKERQLDMNIWKEIYKFAKIWNTGEVLTREIRKSESWMMVGFVAGTRADEDVTTKAQGIHAEHLLIILEEMPGIDPALVKAFSITAGGAHNIVLGLGNPDHQQDALHKFCQMPNVEHVRISALDFPNIVMGKDEIPGAQSVQGLQQLKNILGEGSQLFQSRARGLCPTQGRDSLVQAEWCYDAIRRGQEIQWTDEFTKGLRAALGVDAARSESGDKGSIARGWGEHCKEVKSFPCPDPNRLGEELAVEIVANKIDPSYVGIDIIGPGGETVGTLKGKGYEVVGLAGGDSAVEIPGTDERFENLRSQMYWQVREDLRRGLITMPEDDELVADLTTPKVEIEGKKIKVESKKDYKKRLGRSPDKGDSFVYWNWIRQAQQNQARIRVIEC